MHSAVRLQMKLFPEWATFIVSADLLSRSLPFFSADRVEQEKMDADVARLAKVTDGLIIQTHPSGHRKTQHLAC